MVAAGKAAVRDASDISSAQALECVGSPQVVRLPPTLATNPPCDGELRQPVVNLHGSAAHVSRRSAQL